MSPAPCFRFRALCVVLACLLPSLITIAQPVDVFPVHTGPWAQSLNGSWTFKYIPSSAVGADEQFHQTGFDVANWSTAAVPGHWELQGFAEPKYKQVDEGTGLYRTQFAVPADWSGRRVFLRFEGVLYGFEAWVNGVHVGSWGSGYNPVSFDVTDAIKSDGDNLLAVRVTTRNKGYEFDLNDAWALSGIYRDVTLFSTPEAHVRDLTTHTVVAPGSEAVLHVGLETNRPAAARTSARVQLRTRDGRLIGPVNVALDEQGRGQAALTVANPELWTAETPRLHDLEVTLLNDGQVVQTLTERIGLRQVTIVDGVLLLNGSPIKMRGVNRHDLEPDTGRTLNEEQMRRDLALIKAANINFVRTSHYPLDRRFIALCDELGFYVLDEVPFGFGDQHLSDPSYQDILLTRARATVMRDKNHPSVLIWGIGNENPITPIGLETGRYTRELDPTRPICFPQVGSYFGRSYTQLPEWVDVYAPHYPSTSTVRRYAETLTRPIIHTEYAHGLGLSTDHIHAQWEVMQASPRHAGGALWHFQDQGLLRRSPTPVDRSKPTTYVWLDAHHYYDTTVLDGTDGLVYADRTPQTDYWEVRKVYAPIRLSAASLSVQPGSQTVDLTVESRFDFRSLEGIRLVWALQRNGQTLEEGERALSARARQSESLALPLAVPAEPGADVFVLQARVVDETGYTFYERAFRLDVAGARPPVDALLSGFTAGGVEIRRNDASAIVIAHPHVELHFDRTSGELSLYDPQGNLLAHRFAPHTGRRFTMTEALRAQSSPIWQGALLSPSAPLEAEVTREGDGVRLRVSGRYGRPGVEGEFIQGSFSAFLAANSELAITYDYVPVQASGAMLEAGFAFAVPSPASELRWIGGGPFPAYPGKEQLNEFGLHHLNREDLRFTGNRRAVELAALTGQTGRGIAIHGEPMDLAVETHEKEIVVSQNVLLSSLGNKGVSPQLYVRADNVERIAGTFALLPLGEQWPAQMHRLFGHPTRPASLLKPFYYSYDR